MALYKLQSDFSYSIYAGRLGDNRQILAGYYEDSFIIISFDIDGNVINISKEKPDELSQSTELDYLEQRFQVTGFHVEPILVKGFFLEDLVIGITDLRRDFEDFLGRDTDFSEEEQTDYRRKIADWKSSGNFVFWWKNDFWCDKEGVIIAS